MKNFSLKSFAALSLFTAIIALGSTVFAAPPAPNLQVMAWQGNNTPLVESPYQYTSRVKNVGNQPAQGVIMTIEFPLTNTSPNKYILGKLSAVTPNGGTCGVVSNKLVCNFGTLSNNQIKSVTFTYEFQVATTAPTMTASVTTTSTNEVNSSNNTLAKTPAVQYPNNVMNSGTYIVSSCTGRGLTSFYECEMAPSSIQTVLSLDFNLGGTVSVTGYPSYMGFWDQNTLANKSLHFTIDGEIEFDGFASNGACYKGITTFVGNTTYNSAYRICEQ